MRAIFDFVKEAAVVMDGLWIKNAGNEMLFLNNNAVVYGLYDMAEKRNRSPWGIDNPDEMLVEISMDDAANIDVNALHQLVITPQCLLIEGSMWKITNFHYIRNRYLGRYRVGLICSRYEECTTNKDCSIKKGIHIQCSSGHKFEMNDEPQQRN